MTSPSKTLRAVTLVLASSTAISMLLQWMCGLFRAHVRAASGATVATLLPAPAGAVLLLLVLTLRTVNDPVRLQ